MAGLFISREPDCTSAAVAERIVEAGEDDEAGKHHRVVALDATATQGGHGRVAVRNVQNDRCAK